MDSFNPKTDSILSSERLKTVLTLLLRLIVVCLPIITLAFLSLVSGNNCFTGNPVWSDEIDYWRKLNYFSDNSALPFESTEENGARPTLGYHGLGPFLAYGLPAMIFGWSYNSIVLSNLAYCVIAFVIFVLLVKPTNSQCGLVAVLWLFYPCIYLYISTSMLELIQYAGVIVIISLLIRILDSDNVVPLFLISAVFIMLFSVIRLTNLIFFLPLVFFASKFRLNKQLLLFGLISLAICLFSYKFINSFVTVYPKGFMYSLGQEFSLAGKAELLLGHFIVNVANYFSFKDDPTEIAQRYFYFICMMVFLIGAIYSKRKQKIDQEEQNISAILFLSFAFLAIALLAIILLYDVFGWRDFRTLTPLLWSQLLLVISLNIISKRKSWILVIAILILFAISSGTIFTNSSFLQNERFEHEQFMSDYS